MNERLKKIIFSKLYEDLSHLELIPYEDSIWLVDREEKMWYLEYEKSGLLWWRYSFFKEFFKVFSMERNEFEPIMSEWTEEVLNFKVETTNYYAGAQFKEVKEVLNRKVTKTKRTYNSRQYVIKDVLKHKVTKIEGNTLNQFVAVDEMLRVITPHQDGNSHEDIMERML